MTKFFYEWEDTSDPHATGIPDLGRYEHCRLKTKKAVREEWRAYLAMFQFDDQKRKPKIRVWKIAYEEVKV